MVRLRVQRVVDRHALPGAASQIGAADRLAAAIRQHQIELRDEGMEVIVRVGVETIEGCRGIDVPEHTKRSRRPVRHRLLQLAVEHADAAGFHDDVRGSRGTQRTRQSIGSVLVDDHLRPGWIGDIAVQLASVRVGLVERDVIAESMQRADHPAVVRRRPVPVGGDETGAEERHPHESTA